jgi:hypothetical protein
VKAQIFFLYYKSVALLFYIQVFSLFPPVIENGGGGRIKISNKNKKAMTQHLKVNETRLFSSMQITFIPALPTVQRKQ